MRRSRERRPSDEAARAGGLARGEDAPPGRRSQLRTDGGQAERRGRGSAASGGRGDRATGGTVGSSFDPEELRRRNASAVVIDVLYLFTAAFFATLALRGFWPAVIAALPLATLLFFAWRSTRPFLAAVLLTIGLSVGATYAGLLPL